MAFAGNNLGDKQLAVSRLETAGGGNNGGNHMTDVTQARVGQGRTLPVAIAAAALLALLAFAPLASAATDPVASGTATITLNGGFKKKLKKYGVKLQKIAPAKVNAKKATFTVSGGELDPTTGLGTVSLGGGLKFKAGKKVANVKSLVIDTNKKELSANVAGKKLKLAKLAGWTAARNGFGVNLTVKSLKLTGSAASRLNKKLGFPLKPKPKKKGKSAKRAGASKVPVGSKPFKGNQVLGSSAAETQPKTVAVVPVGNATLQLSPAALKKLKHVGTPPYPEGSSPVEVKLAPIAPTAFDVPTLTATFPIGGGTMSPIASEGTLQTLGGLELVQNLESISEPGNVTTLKMQNIWVDLALKTASVEVVITNPSTAGKEANLGNLGRASIADVSLTGATVTSDPAAHTVSVQGATATLQPVTAETLNQVFINGLEKANPAFAGQEKFAAGDPLGTFSFVAQTQ